MADLNEVTRKVVKASQYVLTSEGFSFADYVSKVETLIAGDKNETDLAKTSFVVVSDQTWASLHSSVTSEAENMSKSEVALPGLAEDDLTRALSKLVSSGVAHVSSNIRELFDLAASDKTGFDLIEEKAIEIMKNKVSETEFEKKKKEL